MKWLLCACLALTLPVSGWVQSGYFRPNVYQGSVCHCYRPVWHFYGGPVAEAITARRDGSSIDASKPKETLFVPGFFAGCYYLEPWRAYGQLEGHYLRTGQDRGIDTPYGFRDAQGVGRLGVTGSLDCTRSFLFTPFIGFQFRQFRYTVDIEVLNVIQLRYNHTAYDIPFGLIFDWAYHDVFCLRSLFQYSPTVWSNVTVFDVDSNEVITTRSTPRDSLLLELSLTFRSAINCLRAIDISIIPYFQQDWYGIGYPSLGAIFDDLTVQHFGVKGRIGIRF